MSDYEKFQLQWMIEHGHSLRELLEELERAQYEDPENDARISTPITELFAEWEKDCGFGSEIWPGEAEYEDCEGKDATNGKFLLLIGGDDCLIEALYRVENYDGRFKQRFDAAEQKWRRSDGEYFDTVLTALREDGYSMEELRDYEVFQMGV